MGPSNCIFIFIFPSRNIYDIVISHTIIVAEIQTEIAWVFVCSTCCFKWQILLAFNYIRNTLMADTESDNNNIEISAFQMYILWIFLYITSLPVSFFLFLYQFRMIIIFVSKLFSNNTLFSIYYLFIEE